MVDWLLSKVSPHTTRSFLRHEQGKKVQLGAPITSHGPGWRLDFPLWFRRKQGVIASAKVPLHFHGPFAGT
jgi:hypothetical protein